MESIVIKGLRINGHIGVLEQERRVGNEFVVDICIKLTDVSAAMANDNIEDTVNYADVVAIVKQQMSVHARLLENVAGRIRHAICDRFGRRVSGGSVTVAKIAPPIPAQLDWVSFTTEW